MPGPYGSAFADGDANHDGIGLTVGDLVALLRLINGTPPPIPFDPLVDMNGDCVIDMADAQLYSDYFQYGPSVFDPYGGYPVPTCSPAELYSRPGILIKDMIIRWFGVTPMDPYEQGWYDPVTEEYFENDHWLWNQYDICLPESLWVWQNMDSIYWLNISAFVTNDGISDTAVWGWKSSYMHWNDDAVWAPSDNLAWEELYEPPYYDYIPGDVDHDGDVDNDDVVFLTDFYFNGFPVPPFEVNGFYPAADVNGNCDIDLQDLVILSNYVNGMGDPLLYCEFYPPMCNYGTFGAVFDPLGNLTEGWGTASYGEGWYLYEMYGWWNIWWFDHPYDPDRKKTIHYEVDFTQVDPGQPAFIEFAVNWSSELWTDETEPPLPGVDEDLYIERVTLYEGEVTDTFHLSFDYVIPDYNPVWVSVDVIASNVMIEGSIEHCCVQSLDLSFVITGEPPEPPPLHEGDVSFHNVDGYRPSDGDPRGTRWHELWPNYCELWDLTSWFDNGDGILSVCDYVDFTNVLTSEWRKFHVEWIGPTLTLGWEGDTTYVEYICNEYPLVDTIFEPLGTWWHEVYPTYCEKWNIISWEDNGNGYLDYCDWIVIRNYDTGETRTVHVERVDTDIIMKEINPSPPEPLPEGINLHNTTDWRPTEPPFDTYWHELYPEYCNEWILTSWIDNGDDRLSVCDTVDFNNVEDVKYHIEWIGPTIELFADQATESAYFDYIGFDNQMVEDIIDPLGTYWHEIYPTYSQTHFVVRWIDNGSGILDYCDTLIMQNLVTGGFERYHVRAVQTDIIIKQIITNCCIDWGIPGDATGDYSVNLTDILNCISYVYVAPIGEPQAFNGCNALYDVDGSGPSVDNPLVNLTDILDMISHVYVEPIGEPVLCCPPGCIYP
jgi:hypothetical protein